MAVWFSRCSRSACGNPCWMKCGKKRDCPHISPGLALGDRFIPAFAGNACRPSAGRCWRTVHPRVCGERASQQNYLATRYGSSPRLRGTLTHDQPHHLLGRFIPAFAGNAPGMWPRPCRGSVHPRVCGERRSGNGPTDGGSGSSPRLRGTHNLRHCGWVYHRFIPAFAGNARAGAVPAVPPPVHPRVCGERMSIPSRAALRNGSSPRLRGTHVLQPARVAAYRFIPAFAGNANSF